MPSAQEDEAWEQQQEAAAVPADVVEGMEQYVRALTTPESEMEQQVLEVVQRWSTRHEPQQADGRGSGAAAGPGAHCQSGSSMSDSRSSSPSWSDTSDTAQAPVPTAVCSGMPSSSGRSSSEEGSSAAWRLCSFLQRSGWPVQHCASVRSGSDGSGGAGWRFNSGHEFLLLFPRQGVAPGGNAGMAGAGASGSSDESSGGGNGDTGMADAAVALVIDPAFSTQFALASPTPRYQVVLSLLPRMFVGTYDRLQRLVEWACGEMQGSFGAGDVGMPPWRSLAHVLNKWRLAREDDECEDGGERGTVGTPQSQQLGWQSAGGTPATPSAAVAAAFTEQQQQSMRALLQQPVAAQLALTTSSSCSSMDVVGMAPPAVLVAAGAGVRSLLTRDLSDLAAAGAKRQHQHQQGPPPQRQHMQQQEGAPTVAMSLVGQAQQLGEQGA